MPHLTRCWRSWSSQNPWKEPRNNPRSFPLMLILIGLFGGQLPTFVSSQPQVDSSHLLLLYKRTPQMETNRRVNRSTPNTRGIAAHEAVHIGAISPNSRVRACERPFSYGRIFQEHGTARAEEILGSAWCDYQIGSYLLQSPAIQAAAWIRQAALGVQRIWPQTLLPQTSACSQCTIYCLI